MVPDDHLEFLHAVWTRRPQFTYIFFGANILIFFLMALTGGSTDQSLIAFGVKSNAEIAQGQWWRFVTPIFIHIGLLHLFFNSYALWIVGPQVEKLYGPARFVILYVVTGIAGVYGSYVYHPDNISAGASGAIFGLFGVLLTFGIRYRNSIPPFFKRAVGTGVLPIIVLNLVIGYSVKAVDNSAHISGLLAGAVLAAVIPFQKPGEEPSNGFKTIQMVLLATIVVSFFFVARNYNGPDFSVRNLPRGLTQILPVANSAVPGFIDAINTAQKTFEDSEQELNSGRTDRVGSMKSSIAKSLDRLRKAPSLAPRADELTASLQRVMQDQYALVQDIERSGTITLAQSQRLKENKQAYDAVMADFSKWVRTDGLRYGIQEENKR
jgi:rhomboid protease GluP